jgi:hypothetical protein
MSSHNSRNNGLIMLKIYIGIPCRKLSLWVRLLGQFLLNLIRDTSAESNGIIHIFAIIKPILLNAISEHFHVIS